LKLLMAGRVPGEFTQTSIRVVGAVSVPPRPLSIWISQVDRFGVRNPGGIVVGLQSENRDAKNGRDTAAQARGLREGPEIMTVCLILVALIIGALWVLRLLYKDEYDGDEVRERRGRR